MLQFLGSEDVWPTFGVISRKHEGLLFVAVPYMGADGCANLLYLRRGNVLVVALTERNSRNGSVCPDEIGRLQKKGATVFLSTYLSSQGPAVRRDNKAVVGSGFSLRLTQCNIFQARRGRWARSNSFPSLKRCSPRA
jgi:hypothetical protein